jgi:molybdopterin-guanine dinucleotide biosynthesis protein A
MSASVDAAGFVLAGGRSSRMGAEKALVELAGEPLIVHALRILRGAGLAVWIAGARLPLASFAPVVPDAEPDRGPLGGICAALACATASRAVFLPVDMPLLPPALVAFLLKEALTEQAVVTVPALNGYAQTFPAVVDRAALPWLHAALESGRGGCYEAFQLAATALRQAVHVAPVEDAVKEVRLARFESLPVESWFLNVNEPADLARAEAWLAGRGA